MKTIWDTYRNIYIYMYICMYYNKNYVDNNDIGTYYHTLYVFTQTSYAYAYNYVCIYIHM